MLKKTAASALKKTMAARSAKPSKPSKIKPSKPAVNPEKTSAALVKQVLSASNGILRLAPTWVPRSFLMPGRRLKLRPQDLYALGAKRGGIDERWFSSTTPAANEGASWDEGLSYVVQNGQRVCTLREAISQDGESLIGPDLW